MNDYMTKEIQEWAKAKQEALEKRLLNPYLHEQQRMIAIAKLEVITDLLNFISGNGE